MKRVLFMILMLVCLTGCSVKRDIEYVADKYDAEIVTSRMDNKDILYIDKNEVVMLKDPATGDVISINNGVVIKTVYDVNALKQFMSNSYVRFVSDKGKDIRGIDQHYYDKDEYVYLIYSKDNIGDTDINEKIKYIVIEDMEIDRNYVLEVPDSNAQFIYLK